jgi:hypothetical protein
MCKLTFVIIATKSILTKRTAQFSLVASSVDSISSHINSINTVIQLHFRRVGDNSVDISNAHEMVLPFDSDDHSDAAEILRFLTASFSTRLLFSFNASGFCNIE